MTDTSFITLRHQLHQHPELSDHEKSTAALIVTTLKKFHPTSLIRSIGGYGILAEFFFSETGPTILFRADIDAVAINEPQELMPYSSQNPGVAHKCGHDGHTTILLRFAQLLHQNPLKAGRILLLFQPAEETGHGAAAILSDLVLQQYHLKYVFALHNIPGIKTSTIVCKPGSFTCAVVSTTITLTGKPVHASEPCKGISPIPATLKIMEELLSWNNYDISSQHYFVATPIEIHMGKEAYGIAAGDGVIRMTLRAKTNAQLQAYKQRFEAFVSDATNSTQGLKSHISWFEPFAANENDQEAVNIIQTATQKNNLTYSEMTQPFSWGEDFGLFTQTYRGAMFGLGAGEACPPLHSIPYDFPDTLIETGAQLFYTIATLTIEDS